MIYATNINRRRNNIGLVLPIAFTSFRFELFKVDVNCALIKQLFQAIQLSLEI